jgi:hypothetical protein
VLEEVVVDIVQDHAMSEAGPYILVGFLTLVMFVGYQITNRVENTISRRKGS